MLYLYWIVLCVCVCGGGGGGGCVFCYYKYDAAINNYLKQYFITLNY